MFTGLAEQEQSEISQPNKDEEDSDDEDDYSPSDMRILLRMMRQQTEHILALEKRIEVLASNEMIMQSIKMRTKEELKYKLYSIIFRLHDDLQCNIRHETVYKITTTLLNECGPGPILVAVDNIYGLAIKREVTDSEQGVMPLIITQAREVWKTGKYANPVEVALLLSIDPAKAHEILNPVYIEEAKVITVEEDYVYRLVFPHTIKEFKNLTQKRYCILIENSDLFHTGIEVDIPALEARIEEVRNSDSLNNLITCRENTPFFFEDFIKEKI
jgi:hypothetical protein